MDEVPGQGDEVTGSLADRSDHHGKDPQCDLCAKSEQVTSATGYCQNCHEFLCIACILYHKKFTVLNNHTLLEAEHMPNERPTIVNIEKCSRHPDRAVEAYCSDEEVFGCALCFVEGHRTCQNVATVLNVLKNIDKSDYIADIHQVAKKQTDVFKEIREKIQEHRLKNEQCHSKCLQDFQTFRAECEVALDILGEEISQEADKLQKENLDELNNLEEMISLHEKQLVSCMQDIDRLANNQQQHDQLFITVKKSEKLIVSNAHQLHQRSHGIYVSDFYVDFDHSIKLSLGNNCKIKVKQTATKCTAVSKVYIKSPEDTEACQIRGILFISATQFIMSDNSNKCLKLYDMESNKILQRRSLSSAPWDITELPGTRMAVTLPGEKQILFFTADQNMDRKKSIQLTGNGRGLQCTGDRLVVACHKPVPQIQILDFEGNVIQSIQYGGCINISSWRNHTIHVVSRDGTKIAIIPKSESRVIKPEVLSFSSQNQTLYVACGGRSVCDYITILRLA